MLRNGHLKVSAFCFLVTLSRGFLLVEMTKTHRVRVLIINQSNLDIFHKSETYFSGRPANEVSWLAVRQGEIGDFLSYERDYSLAGCSGYVTYEIGGTPVSIAFSNPLVGTNKLGVGTGGQAVWDNMTEHDYEDFTERIEVKSGPTLTFQCQCTAGPTNLCVIYVKV